MSQTEIAITYIYATILGERNIIIIMDKADQCIEYSTWLSVIGKRVPKFGACVLTWITIHKVSERIDLFV